MRARTGADHRLKEGATLLIVVVALAAVGALRQGLAHAGHLWGTVGFLVTAATGAGLMLGLSWILPRRAERITDLLPGAAVVGLGSAALQIAGAWYFTSRLQASSQVYGVLGVVVTVLLYLFIVGELVVLAVVADTVWYDRAALLDPAPVGDDPLTGESSRRGDDGGGRS